VSRKEEEMRGWMDLGALSRPRSGAAADRGGAAADRGGTVTRMMRGEMGRRGAGEGRSRVKDRYGEPERGGVNGSR
jgi:hypothetical protein